MIDTVAATASVIPAWAETTLAILGAVTLLLTALANLLPKALPLTQALAKVAGDYRGVVPLAAAKQEAIAQLHGQTTVPTEEQHVGPPPPPPAVPTFEKVVAQAPPTEPTRSL